MPVFHISFITCLVPNSSENLSEELRRMNFQQIMRVIGEQESILLAKIRKFRNLAPLSF